MAVSFLFGVTETILAVSIAFAPGFDYEIPVFLAGTFIAVYACMLLFAKMARATYMVRLWHVVLVYILGVCGTVSVAYAVAQDAEPGIESSLRFFYSGMGFAYVFPVVLLLLYDRILVGRQPEPHTPGAAIT
ncbi:MAG: hypothetical protein K8S54_09725 [Spirochaetia bacterium]|nr:hypothetical protein [Spirochaetia bacterium]